MSLLEIYNKGLAKVISNKNVIECYLGREGYQKKYSYSTFKKSAIVFMELCEYGMWTISLEFGKLHPTSQNYIGMKKDSKIYEILEKIEPTKMKKLEYGTCLEKQEEYLYGVHITGMHHKRRDAIYGQVKTVIDSIEEKSKEESFIEVEGLKIYIGYDVMEALSKDEECVLTLKEERGNRTTTHRQGFKYASIQRLNLEESK